MGLSDTKTGNENFQDGSHTVQLLLSKDVSCQPYPRERFCAPVSSSVSEDEGLPWNHKNLRKEELCLSVS